jgi:hypothetical protein
MAIHLSIFFYQDARKDKTNFVCDATHLTKKLAVLRRTSGAAHHAWSAYFTDFGESAAGTAGGEIVCDVFCSKEGFFVVSCAHLL